MAPKVHPPNFRGGEVYTGSQLSSVAILARAREAGQLPGGLEYVLLGGQLGV